MKLFITDVCVIVNVQQRGRRFDALTAVALLRAYTVYAFKIQFLNITLNGHWSIFWT